MAFEWSYKNQNLTYRGKFQWFLIEGKEIEFELSEFELTK